MGILDNIRDLPKQFIYEAYLKTCNDYDTNYNRLTGKEMIHRILKKYEDPYFFLNVLTREEIEYVRKNISKNFERKMYNELSNILVCSRDIDYKRTLTSEIKDNVLVSLDIYKRDMYKIEESKKKAYLLVGLLRAYGALKESEIEYFGIYYFNDKKSLISYLNHPYVLRFIALNQYYKKRKIYSIFEFKDDSPKDILDTHAKEFKTVYDMKRLINIGKYYFDVDSVYYKKLKMMPKFDEFNCYLYNEFFMIAGYDNIEYLVKELKMFNIIKNEKDDFLFILAKLFDESPRFFLNDSKNSLVPKEISDLFYSVFKDYLNYCANKYKITNLLFKGAIDQSVAFDIIEKNYNDNFKYLNDFISNSKLTQDQISILNAISKGNFDMFIAIKDTNDGIILADRENNLYLVKGLYSDIAKSIENIPSSIITSIFEYEGYYLSVGIIKEFPLSFGENLIKKLNSIYELNKDALKGKV